MHFKTSLTAIALAAACSAGAQPSPKSLDVSGFFAEVDRNKDGCASAAEWKRAGAPDSAYRMLADDTGCVTLARMNAVDAPAGIDANGDGRLTLSEFKAFDKKMSAQMARDAAMRARIDVAAEVLEIQNLMSRRAFYHSVGQNEKELELWARKREIRWAQNQGCWIGMKSLKVYYDDVNRRMQAAGLSRLSKLNPAIRDVPENRFVGNTILHLLTTPIIEIAADGQSAKGLWYTPGAILTTDDGKTPQGLWIWERYGVDFVKEDGRWAFLNIQVNTDFMSPMGKPLGLQGADAAGMGSEGAAPAPGPGAEGIDIPGPDIPKRLYAEFGATRVPMITPRMPERYRTLGETFQYADCTGEHDKSRR